jgi:hypothetical protein
MGHWCQRSIAAGYFVRVDCEVLSAFVYRKCHYRRKLLVVMLTIGQTRTKFLIRHPIPFNPRLRTRPISLGMSLLDRLGLCAVRTSEDRKGAKDFPVRASPPTDVMDLKAEMTLTNPDRRISLLARRCILLCHEIASLTQEAPYRRFCFSRGSYRPGEGPALGPPVSLIRICALETQTGAGKAWART